MNGDVMKIVKLHSALGVELTSLTSVCRRKKKVLHDALTTVKKNPVKYGIKFTTPLTGTDLLMG